MQLDRPDKYSKLLYALHRITQWLIVGGSVAVALFLGIMKIAWVLWPTHVPELTGFARQWISGVVRLGGLLVSSLNPWMSIVLLLGVGLLLWVGVSWLLRPRFSVDPEQTQGGLGNWRLVKLVWHFLYAVHGLLLHIPLPKPWVRISRRISSN